MPIEHFASFGAVNLSRGEAFDRVTKVFKELGVMFDVDFYELGLNGGRFEYTGTEIEDLSAWHAIDRTAHWAAVELHMTLFERGCSVILLTPRSGASALVFVEPSGLVQDQSDDCELEFEIVTMLARLANSLGSAFCVVEPGWTCQERTTADIEAWARDIELGRPRDWVHVLLAEEVHFGQIYQKVLHRYQRSVVQGMTWFHRLGPA